MISIALVHVCKIAPINLVIVSVLQLFESKFSYLFYYRHIFMCMACKLFCNLGVTLCVYSL
jgi:hypothetical protein